MIPDTHVLAMLTLHNFLETRRLRRHEYFVVNTNHMAIDHHKHVNYTLDIHVQVAQAARAGCTACTKTKSEKDKKKNRLPVSYFARPRIADSTLNIMVGGLVEVEKG